MVPPTLSPAGTTACSVNLQHSSKYVRVLNLRLLPSLLLFSITCFILPAHPSPLCALIRPCPTAFIPTLLLLLSVCLTVCLSFHASSITFLFPSPILFNLAIPSSIPVLSKSNSSRWYQTELHTLTHGGWLSQVASTRVKK